MARPVFPPIGPPSPPQNPSSPTRQPSAPGSTQTTSGTTGLPTQPVNQQTFPNLQGLVHPEVERAIRVLYEQIYDLQNGTIALQKQLIGGAIATAVLSMGTVGSVTIQSGGYYQVAPTVTFSGGGASTPATGHAVLTANSNATGAGRVTSVVVDTPGAGYSSAPTVVFTVE